MAKPIFTIRDIADLRLVKFEIPGGVTTPMEFSEVVQEMSPQLSGAFVVLVNGRGPVWGYGMIFHEAHPSLAIATYDPRLGYVVTQTHDARYQVGQVIGDPEL
jgi:CRISPR-associated protein Csx3